MCAFTGVLDTKRMKEEGNSVVLRGCEGNCAIQVIVIIIWPSRALQMAESLVIVSVATCNLIGETHAGVCAEDLGLEDDDGRAPGRIERWRRRSISATDRKSWIYVTLR